VTCVSPEVGEGAVGGIEDALSLESKFLAEEEDLKKVIADFDGGFERGAGEFVELGVWVVVGGACAKFFGKVEGLFHGEVAGFWVVSMDDDFKESSHEGALSLDADGVLFFGGGRVRGGFILFARGEENEKG